MDLIAAQHDVAGWITGLFGGLLAALILTLALEEKIHAKKSIIVAAFAVLCLLLGTATGIITFQSVVVGSYAVRPVVGEIELEYVNELPEGETDRRVRVPSPQAEEIERAEPADEPPELHVGGEEISMPAYIPGVDWSVIAIILGSSLFVDVTSRSGLFSWIAIRATRFSGGDPLWLLILYGAMTVVFSAVLNNVTAMIIVGSLTYVSLEKLGRRDQLLAFLLLEGLLTNIGGLLTLISSVPNIIVGTAAGISFLAFFLKSAPFVVLATVITLWMGTRIFGIRPLRGDQEKADARELVSGFDENDGIESKTFFRLSVFMLSLFIVLIAGTSALPVINNLGMGFVAMSMAVVMLTLFRAEVDRFYKAVDWDLIGFFVGLFIVIYVMEHAQVLAAIGRVLQSVMRDVTAETALSGDAATLLVGSAAFSSVTDNIPLAAMLANILRDLGTPDSSGLWWSVIFGANLGGNLTPIGSASTLVAVTIMHRHDVKISFLEFVKLAFPFAFVQLVLAVLYVLFIVPLIPTV